MSFAAALVSPAPRDRAHLASTGVLPEALDMRILFSDVRLHQLSQDMEPEALILSARSNAGLAGVSTAVMDKFAATASWRCSTATTYARPYVRARHAGGQQHLKTEGLRIHQMGIGIHRGEAVIGNLGSPEHLDYTLVGKTVNLAARLCSMAESLSIVVSRTVRDGFAGDERLLFGRERRVLVRGFKEPIPVYDLERNTARSLAAYLPGGGGGTGGE
jgi:hypothetical protein